MKNFEHFNRRIQKLSSDIWYRVSKIDDLKGQWIAGAKLSPQILGRLKKSTLITSAGASTRIEGAKLSDKDIENLMHGIGLQRFSERDKAEVKGYYELLENIFEHWKHIQFSENTIKTLHKELLKYVEKDQHHLGEYKKLENRVDMYDSSGKVIATVFETTPPYLTPKEMQELVQWTQISIEEKRIHPLLIIGHFIVEFLKIHPFQDGNGRLSRVLTNYFLLKAGYLYIPYISHEKIIEDNKSEYYIALRRSQKTLKTDHPTIVPWLQFFLEVLFKQAEMALSLLSKENIEKFLSPKQLAVWHYLKSVNEASPLEISLQTGIARPTINQALNNLLNLRKIERIGLGRATRYRKIG